VKSGRAIVARTAPLAVIGMTVPQTTSSLTARIATRVDYDLQPAIDMVSGENHRWVPGTAIDSDG
jgi:hypothetical protein